MKTLTTLAALVAFTLNYASAVVGAANVNPATAGQGPSGEKPTSAVLEPARVLMIGGYQSSTDNMPQMLAALLQHTGFAEKVEGFCVSSGESAWPTSNQRFGAMNWVRGKGEVRFPVDARTGTPFAQGPLKAVVLEVGSSYLTRFPTDRDAIRDFVAAAAERQLPAVLFLLPESISVTRKGRADRPQTYVPKTMADFEKEYAAIDAVYQSVIQQFDVPVAPVHRVFLELHKLAPEMDLSPGHEDCYFSPREHYLAACTIAMVLHALPKAPINANEVMEPCRLKIEEHNKRARKANGKERPWFPLSDAEQATIRQAVETAVMAYEKDRQAYWQRIPKTTFMLDTSEIAVGAKAQLRWQEAVAATQGEKPIPSLVLTGHEGNVFVRFQAVPDAGSIRISRK